MNDSVVSVCVKDIRWVQNTFYRPDHTTSTNIAINKMY